jgi:hypothetical protein
MVLLVAVAPLTLSAQVGQDPDENNFEFSRRYGKMADGYAKMRADSVTVAGYGGFSSAFAPFAKGRADYPRFGIMSHDQGLRRQIMGSLRMQRPDIAIFNGQLTYTELNHIAEKGLDSSALIKYEFMKKATVIIVHKSNSIKQITYEQIDKIFRKQITQWTGLGNTGKISLYGTKESNILRRHVLKGKLKPGPPPRYGTVNINEERKRIQKWMRDHKDGPFPMFREGSGVIEKVAKDKKAIGFLGYPLKGIRNPNVRLVPVVGDHDDQAVAPTLQSILFDRYPLQETYWVYVRPDAKKIARDFFQHICTTPTLYIEGGNLIAANRKVVLKRSLAMEFETVPKGAKRTAKLILPLAQQVIAFRAYELTPHLLKHIDLKGKLASAGGATYPIAAAIGTLGRDCNTVNLRKFDDYRRAIQAKAKKDGQKLSLDQLSQKIVYRAWDDNVVLDRTLVAIARVKSSAPLVSAIRSICSDHKKDPNLIRTLMTRGIASRQTKVVAAQAAFDAWVKSDGQEARTQRAAVVKKLKNQIKDMTAWTAANPVRI